MATIIAQRQREKPDLDPRPMALFGALARTYFLISPVIEILMAKHGLARGIFDALFAERAIPIDCRGANCRSRRCSVAPA
jgi:hypothetical protein